MSDSELSDAPSTSIPTDAELKASLREEVKKAIKAGAEVTVRRVRDASVQALGLPEGFYTSDKWKPISKDIIHAEHDRLQNQESQSPVQKTKAATKRAAKEPPSVAGPPPKKRKPSPSDDDSSPLTSDSSDIGYAAEEEKPKNLSKSAPKSNPTSKNAKSTLQKKKTAQDDEDAQSQNEDDIANGSESEMSVVLDDEPAKKRRSKSKDVVESKSKQSKSTKAKAAVDDDPDREEIKKLQGWLVKCGVRKVWGKELKPYETSKAKIKHLKEMLSDVGMTGRFSNEKASQIKEARELAADIEAVQEGAQRWGKDEESADDDDAENRTRGGRRIVRGAKNYDFLSSDGEETD